jgi:hypothetical protein
MKKSRFKRYDEIEQLKTVYQHHLKILSTPAAKIKRAYWILLKQ